MINNDEHKIDDLEEFILKWNEDFPLDRWWRKEHKVPFNSSSHREVSILDMLIEFRENGMIEDYLNFNKKLKENPYIVGTGNYLFSNIIERPLTDEEFDNIDLSKF